MPLYPYELLIRF